MSDSEKIVLLDGGMGQELIKRSRQAVSPLWSAQVLMEEAHLVEDLHSEYIAAGAGVITLSNYTATPSRLERENRAAWFKPLHELAITAATKSRASTQTTHKVKIAGCLPPLLSSYHSFDVPDFANCLAEYRRLVVEQASGVDLFLCETLSTVREVKAATQAGRESNKPVWVAMTVKDSNGTQLRSGEDLAEGVAVAAEAGASGVLINCSWPEAVTQGLPVLAASGLTFGGYANGFSYADELKRGHTVTGMSVRTDLGPEAYTKHAMQWVAMGARIVGGCCEIGPGHIHHLASTLRVNGHTLVHQLP